MTTGSASTDLGLTPVAPPDVTSLTREQILQMSPEEAGRTLAEIGKRGPAPPEQSPQAARERLAEIRSDPRYLADLFSGSADRRREVEQLIERSGSDRTERLLAGVTDPTSSDVVAGVTAHETIAEIGRLREIGLDDGSIAQLLRGEPIDRDEFEVIQQYERMLLADLAFTQKWLAGDREAAREMMLIKVALNAGYKE